MNILIDGQTLETPEINRGIGIYFKNVINNMIKNTYEHNWYITVSNNNSISVLDDFSKKQIIPIVNEMFTPSFEYNRTNDLNIILESVINEYSIDILFIPNPLMVNVLFPSRDFKCKVFITLFDIIPYVMPINEWPNHIKEEYNNRLAFINDKKISIVSISKYSKDDFINNIGDKNNIYVTELAAEESLFYNQLNNNDKRREPYILFTGGFDYRKNLDGAVKAFAKAIELFPNDEIINNLKFYIVCNKSSESEKQLNNLVSELNLDGKVILTGFISDNELAKLYQNALLFFFPSLYEGFGLPILEAMLAGAYVLSADNSSLPEVCGDYAVLCNASDINDMAYKIKEAVYKSINEPLQEKIKRQEYALSYKWEKTAEKTIKAFETELYGKETVIIKKRLAIITTWPKHESGIANYIYMLMPYLSNYFNIDIFVDNTIINCEFLPNKYGSLYMINELEKIHSDYDLLLYQMGNNSDFHKEIYLYLKKYPGISEIHDFIINHFFYHAFLFKEKNNIFMNALNDGYGENMEVNEYYENILQNRIHLDEKRYPMSHSVSNISKKSILHNKWSSKQIKNSYTIPHACFDKTIVKNEVIEKLKKNIGITSDEIIIGLFGFTNSNKRPDVVIEAVKKLKKNGYKIKLIFWGKLESNEVLGPDKDEIDWYSTGFLDKEKYEAGFIISDIIINLRYPSMGESSGTLCEAMKYGKPVIVSDINQYKEFPDEVCWKVKPGYLEIEILTGYISYLIDHKNVRIALGENAKNYADKILSPANIAKQYYHILNKGN